MPLYEFACDCKNKREVILPISKYDQPQICTCGKTMQRQISVSTVWTEGCSFVFTKEGKGAKAREMALHTLNSGDGGFPSVNKHKSWVQQKAFEGTQEPSRKYY